MARVILHIGRHKTGTSAIQHFLAANPQWLRERGFYLPQTGLGRIAHHPLAEETPRHIPAFIWRWQKPALYNDLHRELAKEQKLTAVITSELFQGRNPRAIRGYLRKHDLRVIVYIRNHLDYLASAYCQKVHATSYSAPIEQYYRTIYKVDYARFLGRWLKQFPDRLAVRKFEPGLLFQGDIIADFVKHGLAIEDISLAAATATGQHNISLNWRVLMFKLHLNQTGITAQFPRDKLYPALVRLNTVFEADKFRLPEKLKAMVVRKALPSDRAAAQRFFGESTLFDYSGYQSAEPPPLDGEEIRAMTEALHREIELGQR